MMTFLLDLDNTLLSNDMQTFLPPYVAMLSARLKPYADGKETAREMIASVQTVVASGNPNVTNLDAFLTDFSRRLACPIDTIRAVMERFFVEDYPKLEQYTTPRPEAPRVIRRLLDSGYRVVIATNPLFPAIAIEQRLVWAGIAGFPYARVTTMENSHFAKPDSRYYQEILTAIGASPRGAWMVGDDLDNDILPAASLGIRTWWLTEERSLPDASFRPYEKSGNLTAFLHWIEHQNQEQI